MLRAQPWRAWWFLFAWPQRCTVETARRGPEGNPVGRGAVSGTWGQLGVPQEGGVDRTAEHYRRESWEGDVPERIEPKARERTRGLAPTSLPTFPQWSLSCQLGNAEGSAKPKTGGGGRGE